MRLFLTIEAQNATESGLSNLLKEINTELDFVTSKDRGLETVDNYGTEFKEIAIIPTCASEEYLKILGWKGIDPPHIAMGRWLNERLGRLLHTLSGRGIDRTHLAAQKHGHCFRVAQTIVALDEADRMTAPLLGVIIPLVAADCDAVVAGQPLLSAGGNELLATAAEELLQVYGGSTLFLFFCEMNIV